MAESKGTVVTRNLVADYLDIGNSEKPDIRVMLSLIHISEPTRPTQFPITADLYKDNKVVEFIRDIGEEQKLGVEADYFRVRLYQPIPEKQNTYYARKFRVGFEISGITGAGGEIMSIDGNMNAIGDAVVGEFNISTKTFTPASEIPGA